MKFKTRFLIGLRDEELSFQLKRLKYMKHRFSHHSAVELR